MLHAFGFFIEILLFLQKKLSMKKITFLLLLGIALGFTGCQSKQEAPKQTDNEKLLFATLYVQQAAEYKALCTQAYNIGKWRLDQILADKEFTKKPAIVVDIDETVLDNSPFEAKSIEENTSYPKYWNEWCSLARAESIAGAQEFLNYAAEKGVETFYISNRKVNLYDATLANLLDNGFPFADSTHLMLRTTTSNKEPRRESHLFDDKATANRHQLVEEMKADFGKKFIVLPNPMYGAWDAAMFQGIETNNKDSVYHARLKSF